MKGALMTNPIDPRAKTFERLFERMDRNEDGAISRKEVGKHLKAAQVPGGLFGVVHNKTKDSFMDKLDSDQSGGVTWGEFKGVAADILPASIKNETGRIDASLADSTFGDFDRNKDGGISESELKRGTYELLPEDTSFRGTMAEVAAKLGIDALDADGDGAVTRDEFDDAVHDADVLSAAGED